MKKLIEIIINDLKDISNLNTIEFNLKLEKDLLEKIEANRLSKNFIKDFISMYETDNLYKIIILIKKEIQTRARKELNNG